VTWHEEYRVAGHGPATYRIFDDGTVVAYGPERDAARPNLWIASAWSAHPLDNPDAVHLGHLCLDAPRVELDRALADWDGGRREL
jgi:hypothetical protein